MATITKPALPQLSSSQASRSTRHTRWRRSNKWAYLFIAAPMTEFLIFSVYMIFSTLRMSVVRTAYSGPEPFVGLANYQSVLTDSGFWHSLQITLTYTVVTVLGGIFIALTVSELIMRFGTRTQTFFKASYYLPAVVSAVVVSMVWIWLFQQWYGLLNYLLGLVSLGPVPWLSHPDSALRSLMLMSLAGGHGGSIVFITAAMGGVPTTLYDAAKVDGAGEWTRFWRVTLPLLRPTLVYLFIMGVIGSFQVFTTIYLMTPGGGPLQSTQTIGYLIYTTAFVRTNFDLAATQSILLAVVILTFSVIQYRVLSVDIEY
ncbi:MAG: carbohydrate ABC transporter permease [Anaerolineae bacterium]